LDTQTYRAGAWEGRESRRFARPDSRSGAPASRIEVELEAGPEAAAYARGALMVLEPRIDPRVMEDVRLLVSELVTNSVRHSGAPDGEAVLLGVGLDAGKVHVDVADAGSGFDPKPRAPGQSKGGGWGLFLVEKLADRWGVARNGRTRVWFEIDSPA
jgi:anti-sigma regulatory factor (Ser/Thr protein kinase)